MSAFPFQLSATDGAARTGVLKTARGDIRTPAFMPVGTAGTVKALTVDQVFDSLAIRVNGPKAWDETVSIDWNFTDLNRQVRLQLSNGALIQTVPGGEPAQLRLTLTKPALLTMLATQRLDGITADGDQQALATLLGLLETADPEFPIVTP